MESISLTQLGIYLTINVAFLGAVWMVVKSSASQLTDRLGQHNKDQEATIAGLRGMGDETAGTIASMRERVTQLETRMSGMPSHQDVYGLGLAVERLIARLDAQDGIIARIDTIVQRQDDYLISRNR
ncbi:MAG: hypothetical protein ABTQ30_15080 [Rhizobiaceae bacterium]